jgi:hypothetical protein
MKKVIIYCFLCSYILISCKSNKQVTETNKIEKIENIEGISLDANHISNNEFKLVYNSIDTISTILIIDKKIIEKSKVRFVMDTIKMQNYRVNVNKDKRTIELSKN